MLRYLRRLADRDIALDRSMIPLGSCTMKLNATSEMIPVTWPEFGALHPFAPADQAEGYREMIADLERMLCAATGYAAVSLQPNAGSQGEYAGLLMIQAYHASRGEAHRNVCLIPASAHGTNPASAQMAGMQRRRRRLRRRRQRRPGRPRGEGATRTRANLAAIMVTYPSTHGVFEAGIGRICEIVHAHGGQVYVDGANLNALVGLAAPGRVRRRRLAPEPAQDVLHSARRRRPGRRPDRRSARISRRSFPATATCRDDDRARTRSARSSAAPYGSASILPISWMYIDDDGRRGPHGGDRERDPRRELHREAPRAALPGALLGTRRARRARMHPRPAAAQGDVAASRSTTSPSG